MGIFSTLFDENERNVRKLKKIADKVEELSERFKAMSDEELQAITPALKERYNNGEKLDALLPEAFAAVREASTRVTGLRHYYVQLLGGITLHQGRIAEMKTGEGKTLVETLPAYLNALTGNGVHVVTVNDYLAKRDAEWMGKIYRFLGMSVGVILHDMKTEDKKPPITPILLTARTTNSASITFATTWLSQKKTAYSADTPLQSWTKWTAYSLTKRARPLSFRDAATSQAICISAQTVSQGR